MSQIPCGQSSKSVDVAASQSGSVQLFLKDHSNHFHARLFADRRRTLRHHEGLIMTHDTFFQCLAPWANDTHVRLSVVTQARTDTTWPDLQARGQQTESNKQLTHKKNEQGKRRVVWIIPTLQLLTKFYDQQRASVHTDDEKQTLPPRARNQAKGPAQPTLVQLNPTIHPETTTRKEWKRCSHGVRPAENDPIRTSPTSCLQKTLFSLAARWCTRPPCWTTSPQVRRHATCNFTPRKPTYFPARHHNAEEASRWRFKEWTARSHSQEGEIKYLTQFITFKNARQIEFEHCISCEWAAFKSHRQELTSPKYPLRETPQWPHHSSTHQERGRWRKKWRRSSTQRQETHKWKLRCCACHTCSPSVFISLHTSSGFVLCFVLILCFVTSMEFLSLWSSTQSVSQILASFTSRKRVFWGVVFTLPVGYNRPPSVVNDQSVTEWNGFVKAIRLRFSPKNCKLTFFEFLGRPPGFAPLPPSGKRTRRRCPLFDSADNAWLKSERFLIGSVVFPDLLREIHQLCL